MEIGPKMKKYPQGLIFIFYWTLEADSDPILEARILDPESLARMLCYAETNSQVNGF